MQAHEMDALVVEAPPTTAQAAFTEAFQIQAPVVSCHVVLARNVKDLALAGDFQGLIQGVELLGFRKVGRGLPCGSIRSG